MTAPITAGARLAAGLAAARPHPYLPDLLICQPGLAGPLLDVIATTLRASRSI